MAETKVGNGFWNFSLVSFETQSRCIIEVLKLNQNWIWKFQLFSKQNYFNRNCTKMSSDQFTFCEKQKRKICSHFKMTYLSNVLLLTSGSGDPWPEHSICPPVLFENSTLCGGSWVNTGPCRSSSYVPAKKKNRIGIKTRNVMIAWEFYPFFSVCILMIDREERQKWSRNWFILIRCGFFVFNESNELKRGKKVWNFSIIIAHVWLVTGDIDGTIRELWPN